MNSKQHRRCLTHILSTPTDERAKTNVFFPPHFALLLPAVPVEVNAAICNSITAGDGINAVVSARPPGSDHCTNLQLLTRRLLQCLSYRSSDSCSRLNYLGVIQSMPVQLITDTRTGWPKETGLPDLSVIATVSI